MSYSDKYKVDVPEGVHGDWEIARFEVSEGAAKFAALRAVISGSGRGAVRPGTYTKLTRRGSIIMSDTPDEIRDHLGFICAAHGRVLIAGLGLGMVLQAVAAKENVVEVTVVEKSISVCELVWPHYVAKFGAKIQLVHADIFEWKPPKGLKYDWAWFDIWDNLCIDNLSEMATLHRKFGRRATNKGSWGKEYLKMRRRRG